VRVAEAERAEDAVGFVRLAGAWKYVLDTQQATSPSMAGSASARMPQVKCWPAATCLNRYAGGFECP